MVFPCSKLRVYISPGICVMLALMILILPIQWILAVFTAALFHEMCHAGAVIICGGRLRCIYIGRRGAQMQAEIFSPAKEMLCTLAGPIG